VSVASRRGRTHIIFQTISSIEELADVAAYTLLQYKFAAWMEIHEATNVDYHLVEDNIFLAKPDCIIKIQLCHASLLFYSPLNFACKN
jgi:hypothetical protein